MGSPCGTTLPSPVSQGPLCGKRGQLVISPAPLSLPTPCLPPPQSGCGPCLPLLPSVVPLGFSPFLGPDCGVGEEQGRPGLAQHGRWTGGVSPLGEAGGEDSLPSSRGAALARGHNSAFASPPLPGSGGPRPWPEGGRRRKSHPSLWSPVISLGEGSHRSLMPQRCRGFTWWGLAPHWLAAQRREGRKATVLARGALEGTPLRTWAWPPSCLEP